MTLLECQDLSKTFGGLQAVADVNMSVAPGEIRAVIGPNGAGKSTLFNLITGALPPSGGTTVFAGETITGLPVHRVARLGIARTFQQTHLFPALTARENARIAAQAAQPKSWQFYSGGDVVARSQEAADAALELLHLSHLGDVPAGVLSHGDQRLLEVAMAVTQRPKLLLLDEPTQGLSLQETERAVQILHGLLAGSALAVILVEHDMEVVFTLAQRITVLHRGRVIADDTPEAVRNNEEVQSAYLGGLD